MKVIKVNGKKLKLQSTFFSNRELLKKYDYKNPDKRWQPEEEDEFLLEAVWMMARPRFGLKPFLTYKRFLRRADLQDIKNAMMTVLSVIHGIEIDEPEDRQAGNVIKARSKTG